MFLLLLLAGCGGPGGGLPPIQSGPPGTYHLGPGDRIRVITVGEDRLTGEFRVNDSGALSLPLLGTVHAAGLTTAELEQVLAARLVQAQLIREPSVSVEVSRLIDRSSCWARSTNAGEYPYQPGMTVVSASSSRQGITYRAVDDRASIVRSSEGKAVEWRAERQTYVRPGDVITIYELRF